jgi:hypothetical protein
MTTEVDSRALDEATELFKSKSLETQLPELLSELEDSARKLNAETANINSIIDSVEKRLITMNLGLEGWVVLESRDIDRNNSVTTEIGFARLTNGWHLAVRVIKSEREEGEFEGDDDVWRKIPDEPKRLLDVGRDLRIAALDGLSKLIVALKSKADEGIRSIQKAHKQIE